MCTYAAGLAHLRAEVDRAVGLAAGAAPADLPVGAQPEARVLLGALLADPRGAEHDRVVGLGADAAPARLPAEITGNLSEKV